MVMQKMGKLKLGINNLGEKKIDYLNPLNENRFNKLILFSTIFNKSKNLLLPKILFPLLFNRK